MTDLLNRERILDHWLESVLNTKNYTRLPLAGDASARRYYRILKDNQPFVVMDAPPPEDPKLFADIAAGLKAHGLSVPDIFASDFNQGFLLLSDFGDRLYLGELNDHTVDNLYQDAFSALIELQHCKMQVPAFNRTFLLNQLGIFEEWYLKTHKSFQICEKTRSIFQPIYELLFETILQQPQVLVHRDYHSRNLMILPDKNPGIIDFQDAMLGPITYDLLSLLQDCYISWPRQRVEQWVLDFQQQLVERQSLSKNVSSTEFLKWFEWTAIQRHLKNLGIFSRLYYRDKKAGYLKDIPLLLKYIREICQRYKELEPLGAFFATHHETVEA